MPVAGEDDGWERVQAPGGGGSPGKPSAALSAAAAAAQDPEDEPICRLCWGEADEAWGGQLVSPCACSGSLRHIHRRCLHDWQRTLRQQGLARRAATCELCKAPYAVADLAAPAGRRPRHARSGASLPQQLARAARAVIADAGRMRCWPALAMRVWRGYVMAHGVFHALRVGASGFAAGMSVGRALIEEQTALLSSVLASMNGLLGSPYAELLWCQAVGALLVGMVSELIYCGVLGGLGGLAYGFATGYVSAIRSSARLVGRAGAGAVSAVAWVAVRALRKAVGAVLRF